MSSCPPPAPKVTVAGGRHSCRAAAVLVAKLSFMDEKGPASCRVARRFISQLLVLPLSQGTSQLILLCPVLLNKNLFQGGSPPLFLCYSVWHHLTASHMDACEERADAGLR